MYIFILLNLLMAFVLKNDNIIRMFFLSDYALYLGEGLLAINFIAAWIKLKKISYRMRYDLFAVGALLIWFAYWPPFFRQDSPLFYIYPLYFALITALFSLVFIKKPEQIKPDERAWLQWLSDTGRFNPFIIMVCVAISLFLPQQFMLFPLTISLLVMRFALACCLDNE
ncbi:MAG: hypothetical protein QM500_05030 [Methylococcales bacterium]